jgi:hypothetical protein
VGVAGIPVDLAAIEVPQRGPERGKIEQMAAPDLLEHLNPVQREAVIHPGGPLLLVAGAGSGKTRVLTRRVAYLIKERGVSPFEILREADAVLQEEVRAAGLYRDLWQSFCVLPVVRSVGVQGDGRTYGHPVVLRPVTSEDAMTADWARLPFDLLEKISTRITNEVAEVNRVTLDITSKPPGTIEWE